MFSSFSRIDKNTLKIAVPLIISNITIPLVGFVDNVMMGHLGSMVYLGAIGIGSIIISYILFSFGFIKSLTTGFVSQHTGSNNTKELLLSLSHFLLISSFLSFLIIFFRDQIIIFSLDFMNASNEVAVDYFLNGKSSFNTIFDTVKYCMEEFLNKDKKMNLSIDELIDIDKETRILAEQFIKKII